MCNWNHDWQVVGAYQDCGGFFKNRSAPLSRREALRSTDCWQFGVFSFQYLGGTHTHTVPVREEAVVIYFTCRCLLKNTICSYKLCPASKKCNLYTLHFSAELINTHKDQKTHSSGITLPSISIVWVWHLLGATPALFTSAKSISPNASRRVWSGLDTCNSSTSRLHVCLFGVHTQPI